MGADRSAHRWPHASRTARLALPVLALALLWALPGSASAATPSHSRTPALDVEGLNHACGVAVDSKGDLYASSAGASKVLIFGPADHETPIGEYRTPKNPVASPSPRPASSTSPSRPPAKSSATNRPNIPSKEPPPTDHAKSSTPQALPGESPWTPSTIASTSPKALASPPMTPRATWESTRPRKSAASFAPGANTRLSLKAKKPLGSRLKPKQRWSKQPSKGWPRSTPATSRSSTAATKKPI